MSVSRAGKYYLKEACRSADAQDRFNKVIWHGRDFIPFPEVKRRLPELKRESARVARAIQRWSSSLYNPPAPWPESVTQLTSKLAKVNARFADLRNSQGSVDTARQWWNLNGRVNRLSFGHLAGDIRARLDLPPAGQGC